MGISVSNDNYDDLAEAILKIYNNRELMTEMGDIAYEFTYKNFTRKVNTQKYIDLFIMSKRRN
jgi:glycosyltransferase involved in cell wall biosynthesis